MWKKVLNSIVIAIICAFLAILQFSFFSALPGAWQQLNLGLMAGMFILFILGLRPALFFAGTFGFFYDILSFNFFGLHIVALGAAILAAYFLLHDWLTNRSLYSFWAAILVAVLTYNFSTAFLFFIGSGFQDKLAIFQADFWLASSYQFAWIFLAAALFFNLTISLIKKYKPFFLEKKQGI